jgi:hypothetical protein
MVVETVTLKLPEFLYRRLVNHADATRRSLEDVILHALTVGSPPVWDDVPAEYQTALAEMDRLDDETLWGIVTNRRAAIEMARYDELLEKNKQDRMSDAERSELNRLRNEADQFMLRKAHAAALLRWRGHPVPNP